MRVKFPGPDLFTGVHVPGLNFSNVTGSLSQTELGAGAGVRTSRHVSDFLPLDGAAVVFIGGDVDQASFGIIGSGGPVFASPQ